MNNCRREGGYCINTAPPRPRRRNRNMRRRMGTRTRKGKRQKPSPRALGAQNTVLPGGARPAAAGGRAGKVPQQHMGAHGPTTPGYTDPFSALFNFGSSGTGSNTGTNSFDPFLGMMMFTRKKRQAQAAPFFEPGEAPIRMPGQSMFSFLNQHCMKSEFDFGCRNTGGMCCVPHP